MAGVFDQLIFLLGPLVLGDEFFFVVEGNPLVIGFEGEHPGSIGEGDTVTVGFQLDQRLRGAFHPQGQAGVIGGLGQRGQKGLFVLGKEVDGSFPGGAVGPAIGDLISPGGGLKIEIGQSEEGSSRQKIGFDIADGSFDASFFMRGFYIARRRVKEVMSRKGQETGIELDGGTESLEDDADQIIVPDFLGDPLKEVESP